MSEMTKEEEPTPEELFVSAIESKERTRQGYLLMAERIADEKARAKMRDLADRARVQRATLQRLYRGHFGKPSPALEASDPIVSPSGIENYTVPKVLRMALEQERDAESNYRFLAERTSSQQMRNYYNELAEFEWKQKSTLQNELAETIDPDDFLFDI